MYITHLNYVCKVPKFDRILVRRLICNRYRSRRRARSRVLLIAGSNWVGRPAKGNMNEAANPAWFLIQIENDNDDENESDLGQRE